MKIGYHLANDGNFTTEHLQLLHDVEVQMVKVLVRLDAPNVDWWKLGNSLPLHTEVVARLYMPGSARWSPLEFAGRAGERLPDLLRAMGGRTVYIEVHNEPNHESEGWGPSIDHTLRFGNWFMGVQNRLWHMGFTNIGFPGLAVGEWNNSERSWADTLLGVMNGADWVGCHCYWQTPRNGDLSQMYDPRLGGNWRWYVDRLPDRKIIVTEAGNSNCDSPLYPQLRPDEQAFQYKMWADHAEVYGVNFFILGGTDDWAGFRIYPETVRGMYGD